MPRDEYRSKRETIGLVTDLYYDAKGRDYFREDLALGGALREYFKVLTVHIDDLDGIASQLDAILIRNTGPKSEHEASLKNLQEQDAWPIFNDLLGKGDIQGKQHLLDLFHEGFPVIPTVDSLGDLDRLGSVEKYLVKPIDGCDSHGLQILEEKPLFQLNPQGIVIQPVIDFECEISFYFIGDEFQYALYAPDPDRRWELRRYLPSDGDLAFASAFISWNTCSRGIQRVDACRDKKGELLLMELEDYNPFLSLGVLDSSTEHRFVQALIRKIKQFITADQPS